jgi:gamma-polyglutamate synthase
VSVAEVEQYFLSLAGNGQLALAVFLVGFAVVFFVGAYRKRAAIRRARAKLPLSIGGWGTRGKSGTERLKAALFHGLGYEVTVKTTGCEAMLIHNIPGQPPHEIFIFRSYDKATIWEQRDTVEHAAALGSEVFLWECMALQPEFVRLLQHDWMRDDFVTLTNAFPDHEDVQGPTGADVAECISAFIPKGSQLITSEQEFLPLFRHRAKEQGTALDALDAYDGDLIAADVLALFPYNEHPRNIALAANLAGHLGIERDLAVATMAEHVVPDLGVLKTYPAAVVRGRTLSFINGMSANERTGFLNNWNRMALGAKDIETMPGEAIITVVNNRWDRVARSEVFARIIVEDAVADAHVLIGTNLRGLRRYIGDALGKFCAAIEIADDHVDIARGRLAALMARQRVPLPLPERIVERVARYGGTIDLELAARVIAPAEELSLRAIREELQALFAAIPVTAAASNLEVLEPADDIREHCVRMASRIALHARLAAMIDDPKIDELVRVAYRELFEDQLVVVDDPNETGDQVIDRCARAVPPGTAVSVMGIQNIKGTGLDFVYRWLALDTTMKRLSLLGSDDRETRLQALRELDGFEDYGMVDAGTAASILAHYATRTFDDEEATLVHGILARVREVHADRTRALVQASTDKLSKKLLAGVESLLDPLDSMRRRRRASAIMQDLIDHRISHGRAAKEMRALYDRQGGGWLTA